MKNDPVHPSLNIPKGLGLYLSPELESSPAWNDAGEMGRKLFFCLHNGLRYKYIKRNGKQVKEYTNHMELAFTQDDFCKKYGCCKETYTRARNRLIYVGLARIIHKGGNGRGDYTTYKLCYLGGKPLPNNDQQRWMLYDGENKNWGHEKPTSKHRVGIKNRFEKGVGGKKPTLLKPTLNGSIPLLQ